MRKSKNTIVKGYKGFDKGLICKGYQYEVGKEHVEDVIPEVCQTGFHFCQNPLDVLEYYDLTTSEFAEVEARGEVVEEGNKMATNKIYIKAKLDLSALIKASVDFIFEHSKVLKTTNATAGDRANSATAGYGAHSATAGDRANSATAGDRANSATAGYGAHSATAGDRANSATAGDRANSATAGYGAHSATAGDRANSATAGDRANSATAGYGAHSATAGNDAHSATAGEYAHSATAGDRANSATAGYGAHSATAGNDAIAVAVGRKSKAKANLGCFIVLAEWQEGDSFVDAKPLAIISAQVDGKKVKADTWYKAVNGKFVETDDSNEY